MWYVLLKYVVYKVIISLIYTKLQALSSIKKSRFFVTSQLNQIIFQQTKIIQKTMSKTVDIQIEKSQNLIQGLRKHVKENGEKDFTETEIKALEESLKKLEAANDEVTRLREELSPKVKHMNEVFDAVKGVHKDLKTKLKGFYPQERWVEYGIPDKR